MQTINDDDLLLYYYRDGLEATRLAEIEDALFADALLRARYTQLQNTLGRIDALPAVLPAGDFEERLWQGLKMRFDAAGLIDKQPSRWRYWSARLSGLLSPGAFASACTLLLVLSVGFFLGRQSVPLVETADAQAANAAVATRVLDAYVAEHLRSTEVLLITAANSERSAILAGNRDLASSLITSNRLYASAAARAGKPQLADFLRQLEPVLLDLANQAPAGAIQSNEGLRDYLRNTDLLFQVRATEAQLAPAKPAIF